MNYLIKYGDSNGVPVSEWFWTFDRCISRWSELEEHNIQSNMYQIIDITPQPSLDE
jgi:hypothetical protein